MKKILYRTLLTLVLVTLALSQMGASSLESPTAAETVLTFEDLGSPEIVMHGPYGTGNVRFNLPAHWILQDGAQLQLLISAFFAGDQERISGNDAYLGAMLDVYFNGELQQSLPLKSGSDILYNVPIHFNNLQSPRKDGSLEISFFLNASIDCDYAFHHTTVLVSSSSLLLLPYQEAALELDLRRLPWPMYQPELKMQTDSAVVVVPTNATEDEMRAALITMAAFARMTAGEYPVQLITANQLTDDVRSSSDIIIVGKPGNLQVLQQLSLPIPVEDSRFSDELLQQDDGVLQMTVSPWAGQKTILVVGGNSDAGVVKAAQALSAGEIQTGLNPDASIIAEVRPISVSSVQPAESVLLNSPDIAFSALGYDAETVIGIGVNWFSFEFFVPLGQEPSEQPYLDIAFSNSALVDPERSGFVVYMNAELIGSARFTEETTAITTAQIDIPFSSLRPGRNQIDIAANLVPRDVCSVASFNGLWMSIYPESALHMPLKPAVATNLAAQDLNVYPYPFINDPSLASTMFVLPGKDVVSWSTAGDIAYDMGRRATGAVLAFDVAYIGSAAKPIDENYDLIVIGIPKELPLVYEMKDTIPAYYEEGTNVAIVKDQQVLYRISADKDLGYLQLFSPPWNDKLTILAVLGTTSEGVGYAGQALIDPDMRGRLKGNFATVDGDQAVVIDTRSGLGTGLLAPNLASTVTIEQVTQQPQVPGAEVDTDATQKAILPALIVIIVLMVLVVLVAVWLRRRNPENNQ